MKPLNESNKIRSKKRKNSWNHNQFIKVRRIIKKSSRLSNPSINKKDISKHKKKNLRENSGKEELYFLSNANLNIINILNTCLSKDYFNDSSFINNNIEKSKENNNISKWKRPTWKTDKSKDSDLKKKRIKTNICSNKTQLGSDIISNKKDHFNSSIEAKSINQSRKSHLRKLPHEKEKSEGKILKNKKNTKIENYYKIIGIKNTDLKIDNKFSNKFRSKSNKRLDKLKIDNLLSFDSNLSSIKKRNSNMFSQLSQKEIIQISENINTEVNYIHLKNKISKLKKKIESKYSNKNLIKNKNDDNIISLHPLPEHSFSKEKKEISDKNVESINLIKETSSNLNNENNNEEDKYRYLKRKICLYDSIDDEEYNDEVIDYYISPNSLYIKIFDIVLFISCLFYFIFVPLILSINFRILKEKMFYRIILLIIDIIYIIDFINNFFRSYQSYDEHLIRKNKIIIVHYLKTWFIWDLIQAVPYFSILLFLENDLNKNYNSNNQINPLLYILLMIKVIKLYKMLNDNSTISSISEILSKNETIDDYGDMIITFLLIIFILHLTTCLFIFLGFNSYPNWVFKLNIQDESFIEIYLISLYFIIVTITTVGYGDITGDSIPEIAFQILLLIIGTIAYSFTISYISNYIIKVQQKSMTYEKNIEILREIRLHHPNMKKSTYQEVLRTLHNEQLYERKDKHLLFDSLPYSLKNELIMEIYKPLIQNFNFFKDVDNSDFIIKVTTSLKSLISFKGDILIQEGDFVKEILFVKFGVLGLSISFDLNNPEISIKKYFCKNEIGKLDINYTDTYLMNRTRTNKTSLLLTNLNTFLINKTNDSEHFSSQEDINENTEHIKILEIRKNEHFGDALMFLNERSPLIAKVRTRTAELLILRKIEAIEIYSVYPNIWKRINKKSLYNMEQIYLKIKDIVEDLSIRYNIKAGKRMYNRAKNNLLLFNNQNKKKVTFIEKNKKESKIETEIKNENKNKSENKKEASKEEIKDKNEKEKEKKENSEINKNEKKSKLKELYFSDDDDLTFKNSSNSNNKISKLNINISKIKSYNKTSNKSSKNFISGVIEPKNNKSMPNNIINKNNNTNIIRSIVRTNSFKILKSNNEIKNYKISEINKNFNFEISVQKSSFVIEGKSLTINKDSKGSLKVNESNDTVYLNESLDLKNQLAKNENIIYNAFINLSSEKENSLQLNSAYENINTISNNKYIDNIMLQNKIKQILIRECIKGFSSQKKNKFPVLCHSPTHSQGIKFHNEKLKSIKRNLGMKINEEEVKNISSFKKLLTKKTNTIDKTENNIYKRKDSIGSLSNNKIINKLSRFNSYRKNLKFRYSGIYSPGKIKRKITKKKLVKVNRKLNTISKNIENANNAINNPNEFYMNFFNNIIQDIDKTDNDSKKVKKSPSSSKVSFYSLK